MSTLSEIFGSGHTAYFSHSSLTRLSSLRLNSALLDKASTHASSKYLTFDSLNPLRSSDGKLCFTGYDELADVIGRPYAQDEKTQVAEFDPEGKFYPTLVFLGMDLGEHGISGDGVQLDAQLHGVPYFALDVTSAPRYGVFKAAQEAKGLTYPSTPRIDLMLPRREAAIYSHARSLLDWNLRHRFCSSCGGRMLSVQGGAKVVCPPPSASLAREATALQKSCPTRIGLHNTSFPRTDPTAVIATVSADSKRVLLGRGRRWPPNYFSCLSGFVEPGESIEDTARRETFEEAGVRIGDNARVVIHSSQPWPYPSTLLVGVIAQCEQRGRHGADESIACHDSELDEAKWFELDELEHALEHGANAMWEPPIVGYKGPRMPPAQLMAHQVLRGVVRMFRR